VGSADYLFCRKQSIRSRHGDLYVIVLHQPGLRSLSYGIDSLIVDGMDPVAVFCALQKVVTEIRAEARPFLIESETYRFHHHAGRLPGSPFGYRTKAEEAEWQAKDPLQVYAKALIEEAFFPMDSS